jgi:hypothetical protein
MKFPSELRWIAGGIAWLSVAWLWFRVAVPQAWGASVTGGLVAIGLGAVALVYALYRLVRAIKHDLNADDESEEEEDDA